MPNQGLNRETLPRFKKGLDAIRFVDALEKTPGRTGPNMLLGALTMTQYAQVHGVHFAHHLRQYGVLE